AEAFEVVIRRYGSLVRFGLVKGSPEESVQFPKERDVSGDEPAAGERHDGSIAEPRIKSDEVARQFRPRFDGPRALGCRPSTCDAPIRGTLALVVRGPSAASLSGAWTLFLLAQSTGTVADRYLSVICTIPPSALG